MLILFFIKYFFGVPHLATCIFILFNYCMNQDWVQELILAWLWHHFHLALGSNPRPFDHEPSALPLDHSFRYDSMLINAFNFSVVFLKIIFLTFRIRNNLWIAICLNRVLFKVMFLWSICQINLIGCTSKKHLNSTWISGWKYHFTFFSSFLKSNFTF